MKHEKCNTSLCLSVSIFFFFFSSLMKQQHATWRERDLGLLWNIRALNPYLERKIHSFQLVKKIYFTWFYIFSRFNLFTILISSFLILFFPPFLGYFINLKRIERPEPGNPEITFARTYRDNKPLGTGEKISISIMKFQSWNYLTCTKWFVVSIMSSIMISFHNYFMFHNHSNFIKKLFFIYKVSALGCADGWISTQGFSWLHLFRT